MVSSDPAELKVNSRFCPPSPVPSPTPTEIPKAALRMPTPEAPRLAEAPRPAEAPGQAMAGENRFQLGCLSASPEPFNFAGTFVSFCMKSDANITLNVYASSDGHLVRQMKAGAFRSGDNNQAFFNALDDAGRLLDNGEYVLELVAENKGHRELRNTTVHFNKKGR